ncbi:MAG: hypothetical protein KF841_10270 [Phycisphaerae bacterium]|nr:hypothetical protein [Phycisphaerae bacterium]
MLAQFSDMTTEQSLFVFGVAIFALMMFMISLRRRRLRDGSPRQYRREIDSATRESTAIRQDLQSVLVELNDLSRTVNGQIDTRFAKLEISIADADRRINELKSLLARAESLRKQEGSGSTDSGDAAGEQVARENAEAAKMEWLVSDDATTQIRSEISEVTSADEHASVEPAGTLSKSDGTDSIAMDETDALHRSIQELSDAGWAPVEIAKRVDRAIGEVELILHLRRRAARSRAGL